MPIEQQFAPQPSQAYSSFDFSPLMQLGQQLQQQRDRQALNNLAARSGYGAVADQSQVSPDVPQSPSGIGYQPGQISRTFLAPPPGSTASTAISGTPMFRPFSSPTANSDVDSAIQATAAAAGMDVPHWKAIASIESTLSPSSNYGKSTQYKGLYQIGTRGDDSEWMTHGKGNVYDPMDNAVAASKLAQDNNAKFKAEFGRDPTPIETYMMHQQGFGFYKHGTMTNIAGNTPKGYPIARTPEQFQAIWGRELERRAKFFAEHPSKMAQVSNGD
jgi:hypothetical protein